MIVFGGGTAGSIAAIQAGRLGARTLLVEKNAMLGGTMTVAGINAPSFFFAWGHQIIRGIGWELVRKTLEETGSPIPSPEATRDAMPRPAKIDVGVFTALCDEAVLQAGVELLFHAMPAAVTFENGGWNVAVCTKSGLRECRAKVLIDATGDANVVALAGFEVVRPEATQPGTLQMHCSGYDPQVLDYAALEAAANRAIAAGELKSTDISWTGSNPTAFLRRCGNNANHLRTNGAETSEGRTLTEVEARRAMLRMYRFFRKQPGLENIRIDRINPETGVRETVTIRGKATVTEADYESGKRFPDAICYAFYPIDEHLHDGKGVHFRPLPPNTLPTIPRGALLPAHSRFLLVAGRCLSSDRAANSALRVQCPCMAMGQAAGVMAALSARTGRDPEELPLEEIHRVLREHDAVVPGDVQLPVAATDSRSA